MKHWKRSIRRGIVWVVAFGAGLYVADAFMTPRSVADDATATTKPSAKVAVVIPADVQAVLDALAANRGPASFSGTMEIDIDIAGEKDSRKTQLLGTIRDERHYRHESVGDVLIVVNAESVNVFDPHANQYLSTTQPTSQPTTQPTESAVQALAIVQQQNPALYVAVTGDARSLVAADAMFGDGGVVTVKLLDAVTENGRTFDHIESSDAMSTRELFIEQKSHRLARLKNDFAKAALKEGAAEVKKALVTYTYDLDAASAVADASTFVFTPPANATIAKAPEPGELMAGGEPDSLVGKAAPTFTLKNLDGTDVTVDGKGGDVVVLDFWATWCPPCRRGLPFLAETAKTYADKGVKVYAVNQQEGAADVRAFLEKQKLDLVALLDADGAVGKSYLVSGIPQTVVIGRNGKIAKVIVGFNPDAHGGLDEAIEAALGQPRAKE